MEAANMQALRRAVNARHPGVVIYGVGDLAHSQRPSDHNPDDTPGIPAAQSDSDNRPEHRALDIMLGPKFTRAQAYALIDDLLKPESRARLVYILFNGWRWSRNTDWKRVEFTGDPHDDHIHISGDADDDENSAAWTAVERDEMQLGDKLGSSGPTVGVALQDTYSATRRLEIRAAEEQSRDKVLLAAVQALSGGGMDMGAIVSAMKEASAQTVAVVQTLQAEILELREQLQDRDDRLAQALASDS